MEYDIKPIETYYNGQHFKSILEARWAAFFDICGWKWAYEPFKINGKIPDFILQGCLNEIIVEIKPEIFINVDFLSLIHKAYLKAKKPILILNDKPFTLNNYKAIELGKEYVAFYACLDPVCMKTIDDFSSYEMNWTGWMFENTDREYFIYDNDPEFNIILDNWRKAGQKVKLNSY